jgi:hypothetical protein
MINIFLCNFICFLMKKIIKLQYKIKYYEKNLKDLMDVQFMYLLITTID